MGNRPFWQHHPDPAMRVPWQVRLGVKTELEMYDLRPKYICPHCGHQGLLSTNTIFKHFGYCKHKDKTMSKEQIQEILDADVKPNKRLLMNQYGDFILTHEELLQVMSTIALDKKDPRSAIALKLMYDYHEKMSDKEVADSLGFTQFVFEVVPPKPAIEELKDTKFIDLTQTQLHVIEKGK
jgi:hypothetical protein